MAQAPEVIDDSFVREVDEEYRRAQLARAWKRYGIVAVVAVALLLAALAGGLWWRAEQGRRAGVTGEEFTQALTRIEAGNVPGAVPVLDRLAASDKPGYAALAQLMQASNAVTAGDTAKAAAIYARLAADTALPPPLRDLATVKGVRLEYDSLPPETVIARLKPLSLPGNPWFGVAGEMTALAQLKAGRPALAGALLAGIAKDPAQPPSLRGRAQQLAQSLGVATGTLTASGVAK